MYPLKFRPVFQKRIWGGQRLRTLLAKPVPKNFQHAPVGESWELADLPAGTVQADSAGAAPDGSLSSIIANGPFAGRTLHQLLRENTPDLLADARLHHGHFPLLIKFLDAQTDLSVQVHPDETYCAAQPTAHLKSEAWYILHADPGAKIYKGLKPGITKNAFHAALQAGQIEPLLNAIKVRAGDCHYLPSGTLHALGAGILAAEVQTPSDTTFRVFDWNRLGPDGKSRTLHIDQALACISFDACANPPLPAPPAPAPAPAARLLTCDYFSIDRVQLFAAAEKQITRARPVIWIVLEGQGVINCDDAAPTAFTRGDTLLLPARLKNPRVKTVADSTWLEVQLPEHQQEPTPVG